MIPVLDTIKAEGLLQCLKKSERTKDKWITVHKAREVCGYGGSYTREALEKFANELPEVERKRVCGCNIQYRVDPPVTPSSPSFDWWPLALLTFSMVLNAFVQAWRADRKQSLTYRPCARYVQVDS